MWKRCNSKLNAHTFFCAHKHLKLCHPIESDISRSTFRTNLGLSKLCTLFIYGLLLQWMAESIAHHYSHRAWISSETQFKNEVTILFWHPLKHAFLFSESSPDCYMQQSGLKRPMDCVHDISALGDGDELSLSNPWKANSICRSLELIHADRYIHKNW